MSVQLVAEVIHDTSFVNLRKSTITYNIHSRHNNYVNYYVECPL